MPTRYGYKDTPRVSALREIAKPSMAQNASVPLNDALRQAARVNACDKIRRLLKQNADINCLSVRALQPQSDTFDTG